jgi:hypothetical protein
MYDSTPTERAPQNERTDHTASVHRSVNFISLLVSILVFSALVLDNHSVTTSTLAGVSFYGIVAAMLILAPHVTQISIAHMREVTTRRRDQLPYTIAQNAQPSLTVVDPLQIAHKPSAPVLLPYASTFVAPHDDSAEREAAAWLLALYTEQGDPHPRKVNLSDKKERPGRVWAKSPSEAALQILTQRGIVHNLGNGIRLSLTRCPTVTAALERLQTGRARASQAYTPLPSEAGEP